MGQEQSVEYYDAEVGRNRARLISNSFSTHEEIFRRVLRLLESYDNPSIVELGCGCGRFAELLEKRGYHDYDRYLGIDFSPEAISVATEKSKNNFEIWDARTFKVDEKKFNLVVMLEFIEHIENDERVFKNIPSGMRILMSVPKFDEPSHARFFPSTMDAVCHFREYMDIDDCINLSNWFIITGRKK